MVIGAGPAGSATASILAEKGHRVLVLERERFPRYHIGESMIPFTNVPVRRLGLTELMQRSAFVRKFSVQFVQPNGKASQPFYFLPATAPKSPRPGRVSIRVRPDSHESRAAFEGSHGQGGGRGSFVDSG